ncbi:hypothetical protein [Streptomyces pseudogriseolus]|uniref:hypothetical protein n=1 Tax=Streptomyces pseudogriseolus TaxID=36817 RepID=UPI003FA207D1
MPDDHLDDAVRALDDFPYSAPSPGTRAATVSEVIAVLETRPKFQPRPSSAKGSAGRATESPGAAAARGCGGEDAGSKEGDAGCCGDLHVAVAVDEPAGERGGQVHSADVDADDETGVGGGGTVAWVADP